MSTIISGSGIITPQLDGVVVNQNGVNVTDDSELSATLSSANTYTDTQVATKATLSEAQTSDIGVNQTWQDVTASRSSGVTYTNTTGKPIFIMITYQQSSSVATSTFSINGVVVSTQRPYTSNSPTRFFSAIISNGTTYSSSDTIYQPTSWVELR